MFNIPFLKTKNIKREKEKEKGKGNNDEKGESVWWKERGKVFKLKKRRWNFFFKQKKNGKKKQ